MKSNGYISRNARAEDKPEVLAFTAHTWESGDYIDAVFDDWLADKNGLFLVTESEETGRIAAIDKMTMLSPTEAWFEGLRVHPDHRGRGLASRLQRYMIGEAARLGAQSIRLLTLISNRPIHLAAYRDGFHLKCVVRYWKWEVTPPENGDAYRLRFATTEEAAHLYEWWRRAAAFRTAGLVHGNWSFAETSAERWEAAAHDHCLFVKADAPLHDAMPPPTALIMQDTDEGRPVWVISTLTALGEQFSLLMSGLATAAMEVGIQRIHGILPDMQEIYGGLLSAGFTPDRDDERLCLFELDLMGK